MEEQVKDRFFARVQKSESCWIWTGVTRNGYGSFFVRGVGWRYAHRISWILVNGPIPDGLCVLHRCDNRPCVNPAHLFLGTKAENTADMVSKGRGRGGVSRGESNPTSKLTETQVREIRKETCPERETAARYGVTRANINYIKRGVTWTHIS